MIGTIVTWDSRGVTYDTLRREGLGPLLRVPTAYRHQLRWQRHLRECGVLGPADHLFYRVHEGRVVLYAMRLDPSSVEPRYSADYLGTVEYPSMCVLEVAPHVDPSALELPIEFDALALTPAIVRRIERMGGVPVRSAGGAYYVPPDAFKELRAIFDALVRAGGRVRYIEVTPDSEIAREIARDGFKILSALLETLKKAVQAAKSEARRQKSLVRLREVEQQLRHYASLLEALADEVIQTDLPDTTANLLMEVAV